MNEKNCASCAHAFKFNFAANLWQCFAALEPAESPSEFRKRGDFPSIFAVDLRGSTGPCGPEGKLWQPPVKA